MIAPPAASGPRPTGGGCSLCAMAMKKPRSQPRRFRTKEARELVRAVEAVGGTVTMTAVGALRIQGPEGHCTVSQDISGGRAAGKRQGNVYAQIERKTGLVFPKDS